LQRKAYNQAFSEAGLDWYWDAPLYQKLLLYPGGITRLTRFGAEYDTGSAIDFEAIYRRKGHLFADMLEEHRPKLRSGVVRLIHSARSKGIKVGWVTSVEQETLAAIMRRSEGALSMADFDVITHSTTQEKPKPDPAPYLYALAKLGIEADDAVAIESTAACMRSAVRADISCIVTPHRFSVHQDYYEAISVLSELGDPGLAATMLQGISLINSDGLVTIESLETLTQGTTYTS